jgi:hypothetical protein
MVCQSNQNVFIFLAQFQGALGRLTAASIHNPRKMITLDMSAGQESDELRSIEVKRFKEVLLRIEKVSPFLP